MRMERGPRDRPPATEREEKVTLALCIALFILGYIIGHGDGKQSGWVDGFYDRPFQGTLFDKVEAEQKVARKRRAKR